ncbi:RhoGAP-domain-containing protein [Coniochaeta ligniaria NRRL 30616]|uniref:RhoGAP-domain-containing protein n=1 Tax=Coniochaeta ligniaria NRRL 30616 TaxID=1408157 RepID=A0A1J7J5N4_9PEZI|nr:RhoGAP-domain-containing protein [Coniochaeta ligniaria NRRL 30616]
MMGPDYGGGGVGRGNDHDRDRSRDRDHNYDHQGQSPPSGPELPYHGERDIVARQNGAPYGNQYGRPPGSPALSAADRDFDAESRRSGERNRSRPRKGPGVSGQVRLCRKCGEPLTGQFVRALDGTFHLDCFKCRDCGQIVASKFFPADDDHGEGQYPLCETDYFRRLGLLCHKCGGALRGSYITALERKYHVEHFTCSLCTTVFGAQDSYYEHEGEVYCHYHYSTQFAQRCSGCKTAILKQFVEIFRNGQNQHWHPECYMIHKFWNVRLNPPQDALLESGQDDPESRQAVRKAEELMEEKVYRIWSVLSTFEESSAACISDMLLHVSNGAYVDGVMVAKKFMWHVDILFRSADRLEATTQRLDMKGMSYGREAKLLCKKIVAFFSLLSKTQDGGGRKLGVTQDLLTLVTGLAHYLKLLIRICLQGALRIEKERHVSDGLYQFLDDLDNLDGLRAEDNSTTTLQLSTGMARLSANDSDQCVLCRKPIEDECAKHGENRWHINCVSCVHCGKALGRNLQDARFNRYDSKIFCSEHEDYSTEKVSGFEHVSKLQQYIFLLQVALARLLEILRSSGSIPRGSEEGNNGEGLLGAPDAPRLQADSRSKSYAGGEAQHHRESSYESTLNDVRRLRSTRLDKHLSSSFRKARTSRIMDGPEGSSARPGSAGAEGGVPGQPGMHIVEERGLGDEGSTDLMFGNQDGITLDDIPRIVAAEQAKEQRSYQPPGRQELFRSPYTEPNFGSGPTASHQRSLSAGREVDPRFAGDQLQQRSGGRKYFSELPGLEYFIVRHLAVLTMHPLVENDFTLEELLGLIESRKPPNFWKNIGKAFQKDGKKNVKKKGVFGVPLEVIIERDGAESTDGVGSATLRIPAIVDDIVATMKQMDLSVEGVFRKNGNIKKLGDLVEKIDRDGGAELGGNNVVQIAALLKRYLRELPDPLLTHKLYRLWLAAAKIQDEEKKRHCLHLTCCLLPKCHRDCLEIVFCFLKWAASFHQVDDESGSKMDIKNLATVIAPNIIYDNTKVAALGSDPIYAIEAVEILITYIEEMCLVPDEFVDMLSDQALYNTNGEITTKEILKRFGDRRVNGGQPQFGDASELMQRHHEIANRPPPRRIETDPSAWQSETSVRTVQQEPTLPYIGQQQGTPPQKWRNPDDGSHSPYAQQQGFNGSTENLDRGPPGQAPPRREWRNSGYNNRQPNGGVAAGSI